MVQRLKMSQLKKFAYRLNKTLFTLAGSSGFQDRAAKLSLALLADMFVRLN